LLCLFSNDYPSRTAQFSWFARRERLATRGVRLFSSIAHSNAENAVTPCALLTDGGFHEKSTVNFLIKAVVVASRLLMAIFAVKADAQTVAFGHSQTTIQKEDETGN